LKKARVIFQILFFLVFFFLLIRTEYRGFNEIQYPVRFFLDFDPLILFSTLLSARGIPEGLPSAMALSLILIFVTIILGRVFCGWICPFGIINHFVSWLKSRKEKADRLQIERNLYHKTQRWKYWLLTGLLAGAVFSVQITGVFDPLSLVIRSFAVAVNPLINFALRSFFDVVYFLGFKPLTAVTEPVYSFLKENYLSFKQPEFSYSFLIFFIFGGILLLNLYRSRFWCRYLCPLGALLGILGRRSLLQLKVNEKCTGCNKCVKGCPAAAEPQAKKGGKNHGWRPSECFICYNCVEACPSNALSFKFTIPFKRQKTVGIDVSRRQFIGSGLAAVALVPAMRVGLNIKLQNPGLIRPPGSLIEKEFLQRCVRCGECMKVCLTNGIQPTFLEAGLEGMFTPTLNMRAGYCEYNCSLCGQVCPTGAIKELEITEKQKVKIGLAFIDRNRCIPYTLGINCIVCEEHCPTPEKAIWFEEKEMLNDKGERNIIKLPRVNLEQCIGCGICENKCPVLDKPAIYVTSIGESRNPDSRILLDQSGNDYY
jgi:polyferredoxin